MPIDAILPEMVGDNSWGKSLDVQDEILERSSAVTGTLRNGMCKTHSPEAAPGKHLAAAEPAISGLGTTGDFSATDAADLANQTILAAVRDGDADALELLYRRHREDALHFAWSQVGNSNDAEDVLHTALTKTISALANGHGPHENFPAYLNTAIKSVAAGIWSKSNRELPVEPHQLEDARERFSHTRLLEPADPHAHVTSALQSLPAPWQTVLWYSEVMQEPPRRIAPVMGITPNAVSALLRRAKTGLRTAYLEAENASAG